MYRLPSTTQFHCLYQTDSTRYLVRVSRINPLARVTISIFNTKFDSFYVNPQISSSKFEHQSFCLPKLQSVQLVNNMCLSKTVSQFNTCIERGLKRHFREWDMNKEVIYVNYFLLSNNLDIEGMSCRATKLKFISSSLVSLFNPF